MPVYEDEIIGHGLDPFSAATMGVAGDEEDALADLLGVEGDYDLIGAEAAMAVAPPALTVQPVARSKPRYIPFGGVATTTTGGVLVVEARMQETAKPTRLIVIGFDISTPATPVVISSSLYSLQSIECGSKSQLPTRGNLNGSLFDASNNMQFAGFEFDTVQGGTDFAVTIADAPADSRFQITGIAKVVR
jgi:hypothetical protein